MIETERLILRAWRDTDRDPFFALNSDPAVMEYLPASDRASSDAAVDKMIATETAHGHCFWAVERKADGKFLGFCGPMPAREPLNEVELGWRLAREAWGRGYATEGARASLSWCWANLDTPTVSLLLGQGTGGGALALVPADRHAVTGPGTAPTSRPMSIAISAVMSEPDRRAASTTIVM